MERLTKQDVLRILAATAFAFGAAGAITVAQSKPNGADAHVAAAKAAAGQIISS